MKAILRGKLAGVLLLELLHIRGVGVGQEVVVVVAARREDESLLLLLLLLLSQLVLIWIVWTRRLVG